MDVVKKLYKNKPKLWQKWYKFIMYVMKCFNEQNLTKMTLNIYHTGKIEVNYD